MNDNEKIMNFFDALGDCGFGLYDILLLKNIWKEAGCQLPKSQIADASKMEQEVELEKEIDAVWNPRFNLGWDEHSALSMNHAGFASIARHFYGIRNRALEEAARHVYESWMGGTMDDVRRDMFELVRVINARKEDEK